MTADFTAVISISKKSSHSQSQLPIKKFYDLKIRLHNPDGYAVFLFYNG